MNDRTGDESRGGPLSWLTNRTLDAIDVDEVIAGVDIDAIAQRLDVDALLSRVDLVALLDRIEPDDLLDRVDPNRILDRVDPDRLLDRVTPDQLLDRVDPNLLLDRVDPNRLLDRVDPDRLLDRVDPDRLLARVDPNVLLDRVDVDRLMDRVDVAELVERAGVADIVAESTGAVAGSVLDVARRQLVGLDTIVGNALYRLSGRDPANRPTGPQPLQLAEPAGTGNRRRVTGSYAGPVSRSAAFAIDIALVFWSFTLGSAGLAWVLSQFGVQLAPESGWTTVGAAAFLAWGFGYWWVSLSLTGRTIGKSIVGLQVLQRTGGPLTATEAAVRTAAMPLSFVLLLGLLPMLVTARRTTFHDAISRTCEVYDWGDRPAELPAPLTAWIAQRSPGFTDPAPGITATDG